MYMDFLDDLGRKFINAAEAVSEKTERMADIAKLKNQIFHLERKMEKNYEAIGKLVYEQYLSSKETEDAYRDLCEALAHTEILIDQYKGEIDELKEK